MKEQLEAIVTKLNGVSGQLTAINSLCEDSEIADAVWGTNDYLNSIINELAEISAQQ